MLLLRLAWIFGFLSTPRYAGESRKIRFGPHAPTAQALTHLNRSLLEDRIALLLFLLGAIILLYTFLNAPHIA